MESQNRKTKLVDYYDHQLFTEFLIRENTEKSKRMLDKINSLDQSDVTEYNEFRWELEHRALLNIFL